MEERKHYNKGKEIAVTFPVSQEQLKQQALTKDLEEELKKARKYNNELKKLVDENKKKDKDK